MYEKGAIDGDRYKQLVSNKWKHANFRAFIIGSYEWVTSMGEFDEL